MADLMKTPVHALHQKLGAKMVPFAGYEMPVQYPAGVMSEHLHTRSAAGWFDVSHMGQVVLSGPGADAALEALVPVDVIDLPEGRQRYGLFTGQGGGILDDLMITRKEDHLYLVVNAARKAHDIAHLRAHMPPDVTVVERSDRALFALQGPGAEAALAELLPGVHEMRFMDHREAEWQGETLWISRSGYTGEDGFEISVPDMLAMKLAETLLAQEGVAPVGLGARDSLRLEAGLCLYGHDIDETTSPVEAGLTWAIGKVRRAGGARAGGFPGADRILEELADGTERRRVGLSPEGRAPMREGTAIFDSAEGGNRVGTVTSGGYGPSVGAPIAMAYLPAGATPGDTYWGEVRGRRLPAKVAQLPFHRTSYKR